MAEEIHHITQIHDTHANLDDNGYLDNNQIAIQTDVASPFLGYRDNAGAYHTVMNSGGAADFGAVTADNLTVNTGHTLAITDMTEGSIPFFGASGVMSQDNDKLFWDAANFRQGIGTLTPAASLEIRCITEQLRLSYDTKARLMATVASALTTLTVYRDNGEGGSRPGPLTIDCEILTLPYTTASRVAVFDALKGIQAGTNTDAQISAAVTASHARSHTLLSTSDHSDVATYLSQPLLITSSPNFASLLLDNVATLTLYPSVSNAGEVFFKNGQGEVSVKAAMGMTAVETTLVITAGTTIVGATAGIFLNSSNNVGLGKAATGTSAVSVKTLPTSSAGLVAGDLWNNSGVVNIKT